jgi:hypothetical protein
MDVKYIDDLGCFPVGCNLPKGMKELCQNFESGMISWPASCNEMPGEQCKALCNREKAKPSQNVQVTSKKTDFTITVNVPENTFIGNAVFMEFFNAQYKFLGFVKMQNVDETTWRVVLPVGSGEKFGYRYDRDGIGFASAQQFYPDSEKQLYWLEPKPGMEINDIVDEWRWFPKQGEQMPIVQSAVDRTTIVDRIDGEKFQRGYQFVDFWWSPFHDLVSPVDNAMKENNANFIKIAPAMDYVKIDPLPEIGFGNDVFGHTYPPEELDFHISQAQKDGLQVFFNPQICCHNPDSRFQYSDEWWNEWFKQVTQYGVFFADFAEKHNITYMIIGDDLMWGSSKAPANIKEKYVEYIATIRKHYSGKLGAVFLTGPTFKSPADLYPECYYPEKFDFIAVTVPSAISEGKNTSVQEMKTNFKKIIDSAVKPLFDKYQMPVILYSVGYPSIDGGTAGLFVGDDPAMDHFFEYSNEYSLDLEEQAQAQEAMLEVVAETPYIVGYYPFNSFWPTQMPKSKSFDIWGKPAGEIVSGWYAKFKQEVK